MTEFNYRGIWYKEGDIIKLGGAFDWLPQKWKVIAIYSYSARIERRGKNKTIIGLVRTPQNQ